VTLGDLAVCGARRRDADPCDAPAGDGTSHPGYGRCDAHFRQYAEGLRACGVAEAIAISELVAGLMGVPIRGDFVSDLRVLDGAVEYCQPATAGFFLLFAARPPVQRASPRISGRRVGCPA
jgi:hypothetical protein